MRPGDYIIMTKPVTEEFAIKYCKEAGVYLGGICLYLEDKDDYSAVIRTNIDTEIGRGFIKEHFKKSHRKDNLDKLLGFRNIIGLTINTFSSKRPKFYTTIITFILNSL